MMNFFSTHKNPAWYGESGPEDDVVISSRARISRNISSLVFPHLLKEEGVKSLRDKIEAVLDGTGSRKRFLRYDFEELTETEADILSEEGRGSREGVGSMTTVYCRDDGRLNLLVNDEDHLRISTIRGGLRPADAWAEADELDTRFEPFLDYAVSLEWGYLSTDLADLGTGLAASTLMHLPGIVLGNQLEKIEKLVKNSRHTMRPCFAAAESKEGEALGDLFIVEGKPELGVSEREFLEKLEEISASLLNYEREMRNLIFEKKKDFLEDQIYRAFGILERARSLNREEAVKLLSLLRLGCSLGYVDEVDRGLVTSMIFLSLPAHVRMRLKDKNLDGDEDGENRERADLISSLLGNAGK